MAYTVAFLAVSQPNNDQDRPHLRPVLAQPTATLHDTMKVVTRYNDALHRHISGQKTPTLIAAEYELGTHERLAIKKGTHPICGVGILFNDVERAGRDGIPVSLAVPIRTPNKTNGHAVAVADADAGTHNGTVYMFETFRVL